jgi:Ser-tRNA(Ala) deacylase AlaX
MTRGLMQATELAYMSMADQPEIDANALPVEDIDGAVVLILDRTPFYPQGGGQPSDVGTITGEGFTFAVRKALLVDGVVHHHGEVVDGDPAPGPVRARIDEQARALHAALHSGGHLIMTAMFELTGLRAIKGYHFPDGAYVEFDGALDEETKAEMAESLQRLIDEMVAADEELSVQSTTAGELLAEGVFMPAGIPTDKPTRVVTTCGYRSPCGGTHVARTGDLAGLKVRRVKNKSGRARVAYEIALDRD